MHPNNSTPNPAPQTAAVHVPVTWQQDKYLKGYPAPDASAQGAVYASLAQVLNDRFSTDAHVQACVPLNAQPGPARRWTKACIGRSELGGGLAIHSLWSDVDAPDHEASDTWNIEMFGKLQRLLAEHGGCLYQTKNGFRIVHSLPVPFVVTDAETEAAWKAQHEGFRRYVSERFGVAIDAACNDVARVYRLPKVVRDGAQQMGKLWYAGALHDQLPPDADLTWRGPLPAPVQSSPKPAPAAGGDLPKATDWGGLIAILETVLPQYGAGATPNRNAVGLALANIALGTGVDQDQAAADIARCIPDYAGTVPSWVADSYARYSNGAPFDGHDWGTVFAALHQIPGFDPAAVDRFRVRVDFGITLPAAPGGVPAAHGLRTAIDNLPYVVKNESLVWLFRAGERDYYPPCKIEDLFVELERRNVLPEGLWSDGKRLSRARIERDYMQRAEHVRPDYMARRNTFDPTTRTMTLRVLRWAALEPVRHDHVDRWLRALAGGGYPYLEQWLASVPALDRPAPILYLHGGKDSGKTLLASGIGALWSVPYGEFKEAVSDFNESSGRTPFMFADEGLPDDLDFGELRKSVTAHFRRVNQKNISKWDVFGFLRIMVAANNANVLRYQRTGTITQADVAAIADRLIVLECGAGAAPLLLEYGKAVRDRMAQREIAEHVLWLASQVELNEGRMAARPNGGEALVMRMAGTRAAGVYGRLLGVLEAGHAQHVGPSETDPRQSQTAFLGDDGALWIKPSQLASECTVSVTKVQEVIELCACTTGGNVAGDPSRSTHRWLGRGTAAIRYRRLDPERVRRAAPGVD